MAKFAVIVPNGIKALGDGDAWRQITVTKLSEDNNILVEEMTKVLDDHVTSL